MALQWTGIGDYYLDAENRFRYPGQGLANFRSKLRVTPQFDAILRATNIFDIDIADRADHAFGDFRYSPGRGRDVFAEFRYAPVAVR